MTTLDLQPRRTARVAGVDIAGTEWPLYKLEALAVGALLLIALFVITGTAQIAVLTAAAATTITWWVRLAYYRRTSH
ncbi:hypothetical protein HCA61_02955 [Rhodococcus sp. HNM0563]|uniref:hypothetical protein n=1 Tax=unclassified Rhodococcus (in: high G+C Gram-positive bacteria) TaxID=192944 RepID=UPI00146E2A35|nr:MULTISPECIES: hypothetical protein [unclassified Rhodococcus (in: high G+C Gram-positive bacteria)]MCK0092876.1 hypothetical protein [Rhodococcus sp. F64268]NLU61220.1 hypothetical protein [Rhodococcus sp. HNM0563]